MIRIRAEVNHDDPRPVDFPPPGPYWVTGSAGDDSYTVIVAYLENQNQLTEYWPEAKITSKKEVEEIQYTDRFPKPDWYNNS